MNISRIALLSAALFFAPFSCAGETPVTTSTDAKPTTTILTKVGTVVTSPLKLADWVADKSYLNYVIGKITNIDCLKDTRINQPALIGKTLVTVAALVAAYKAYTMYNAQDIDNDDDIFGDDDYENVTN